MELKVAVLIPAFSAQATIERTLLSVPDQPWIQIIVFDDGSKPALQINTSFQHAQLTLLRNPVNQGVSSAMLQASQHLADPVEYMIELDADDQLVAGALEAMVALLDINSELDLAWGDLIIRGQQDYLRRYGNYFDAWLVRIKNCISCSTLMRRSAWLKAGANWGDQRLQYHDWFMWLSFARINAQGGHIGQPALIYNSSLGGLHLSRRDKAKERHALTLSAFSDLKPATMLISSSAPWLLKVSLLLASIAPVGSFRRAKLQGVVLALLWSKDWVSFKGRLKEVFS